jgi:hypothetical protein
VKHTKSSDILENCFLIKHTNHVENKKSIELIKNNYIEIGFSILRSYKKRIQYKYSMLQHIVLDGVGFKSKK